MDDFPIYRFANQFKVVQPAYPSRLNSGAAALVMLAWPLAAMWTGRLGRKAWLLPFLILPVVALTESMAAQAGIPLGGIVLIVACTEGFRDLLP